MVGVVFADKGIDISDTMDRNNVRSTQVEILDTETTSSPNNKEVICRECRDAVHVELAGDQVSSVACPSCGVSLEGDAAVQIIQEQALYLVASDYQKAIERGIRGSKYVTYEPGDISDPGGPFILGKPKR